MKVNSLYVLLIATHGFIVRRSHEGELASCFVDCHTVLLLGDHMKVNSLHVLLIATQFYC